MRFDIQSRGFDLTEGPRRYTERRVRFGLSWASHDVRKVTVRLSDINGPRGGEGNRCRIQVAVPGAQNIVIEDTETDLYLAIDRAVDRAGRSVTRRLERSRQHRRGVLGSAGARDFVAASDSQSMGLS